MNEIKKDRFKVVKDVLMIIGLMAVIFIVIIVLSIIFIFAYLINSKPFGIEINPLAPKSGTAYDHPLLNSDQEKVLQSLGVNLETLPTLITPQQEQCAISALGQERVNALKGGSAPTVNDLIQAKNCF